MKKIINNRSLILIIPVLFFLLAFYLAAEENKNLQMSYYTMVYSVTAHEDLAEVNFITHSSIITDDSIPVLIKIPKENNYNLNVSGFNFKTVKDYKNLIQFTLKNCVKDVKNYIAFEVYTLQKISDYSDIPKSLYFSSYSNLSDDLKYFIQSSNSCQSNATEIKTKAYEFFYRSWIGRDIIELLNEIINFTANEIKYKGGMQTALDAIINGHAVCTGKANLAVALSRVLGIPARVLFVFPTHFIAEIYLPNYGWVRGESTMGFFPYAKNNFTIQWIADIDDENYGGTRGGVIAYWGVGGNVNATWDVEYSDIYQPAHYSESFAMIEGDIDLNNTIFEKGKELWCLFCQLKNSGLSNEQLAIFSGYQQLYFKSLVSNDIQEALSCADLAISEAKRLLNL